MIGANCESIAGFLPSKKGARIMFKNVYELSTEDVKVWENQDSLGLTKVFVKFS